MSNWWKSHAAAQSFHTFSKILHRFRRQTHVTPKSYLSFLDGYLTLYKSKYDEIGELARRMNTGLEKLIEASVSVDQLSKELVVKEKDLAVANVKADKVSIAKYCKSSKISNIFFLSVSQIKCKLSGQEFTKCLSQ